MQWTHNNHPAIKTVGSSPSPFEHGFLDFCVLECERSTEFNKIVSMQHAIDKQASLEVQISEEIKKYE